MPNFAQFGNDLYTGKRSINVIGRSKRFYAVSVVLLILMTIITVVRGVNVGIDFEGGSEFQVSNVTNVNQSLATEAVKSVSSGTEPQVTVLGGTNVQVRTGTLTADQNDQVRAALASAYTVDVDDVSSQLIGPSWGQDITVKALQGLVIFLILVGIVMAVYFRNLKTSIAAMVALLHDLAFTAAVYGAVGFEVTPEAVIGFLTILGYSLYDTVVVFDKVRENTLNITEQRSYTFAESVNYAVNQTFVRSINTSVVALLPVAAILFIGAFVLGAGTLKDISLALFIGILVGTYSSVFIAPGVIVDLRKREPEIAAHTLKVEKFRAEQAEREVLGDDAPAKPRINLVPVQAGSAQRSQPRRRHGGRPSGKK
ncbi:protein translocase subunit SecF [Micrococcales bacterium 31B]|nr:protein translocase subunit SecF [Micrococcales bacterium 31B]